MADRRKEEMNRRRFLQTLAGAQFLAGYHALAAPMKGKTKIRDIQTMVMQGPDRNYTFVRIFSDAALYGIGEAYGSPGVGIKEQIAALKPMLIGKDPLEIDVITVGLG